MNKKFSIKARIKSFQFAFAGLYQFFKSEQNAWIHLAATITVIIMSFVFSITKNEAIALVFATGFVWVAEIFNTAIEKIMDFITVGKNQKIKLIKDLSAAAVLVAAVTAAVIGCLVFIPKF